MPNHWTKAKETGIPYQIKEETRKKWSNATSLQNKLRWSKEENRKKIKEMAKQLAEETNLAVVAAFSVDDNFYTGLSNAGLSA